MFKNTRQRANLRKAKLKSKGDIEVTCYRESNELAVYIFLTSDGLYVGKYCEILMQLIPYAMLVHTIK